MAGAGYRLFNTGDVLTAAQVNTFLQEQVVMVFASAAARTTALAGVLSEGMVTYLQSTKVVEIYNGTSWVSLDDPNAIQNAIVDAKGDLIAATANDTPARLAVGNNGETLVADSSATTGLRYNPPVASIANPVINGGFDIWQRGTSFSNANSVATANCADRWSYFRGAGFATGITMSRQTTSDTTNLPNIQYCARVQRAQSNSSTALLYLAQNIESVNSTPFAGKTVTMSFYARKGANYSGGSDTLTAELAYGTGTDQNIINGYTGQAGISATVTLTSTWQRFVVSGTIPATATQIGSVFSYTPIGTAGANDWYEVTGVQIDVGTWTASTAPTFRRSGGTLGVELAACQRYYYRINADATAIRSTMGMGIAQGATTCFVQVPLKVTMRATPTVLDYANLRVQDTAVGYAVTALVYGTDGTNQSNAWLQVTVASGLTQYRTYFFDSNSSSTGYVGFGAEL